MATNRRRPEVNPSAVTSTSGPNEPEIVPEVVAETPAIEQTRPNTGPDGEPADTTEANPADGQDELADAATNDSSVTITTDENDGEPPAGPSQQDIIDSVKRDGSIVVTGEGPVEHDVRQADALKTVNETGSMTITGPNASPLRDQLDRTQRRVAGRPACLVKKCPRPEFLDDAGICGHHFSARADLRRPAAEIVAESKVNRD